MVIYRTAHRVLIQIDASGCSPGTIVGILGAGRITIDGNLGVIGDGGTGRDWKAWFAQLFSRVDGIRVVIGSSSPAPRGAIEAALSAGIQTGGVGLVGERPSSYATLFSERAPNVNARDWRIIGRVREPMPARSWLGYTRPRPRRGPPDPLWAQHRMLSGGLGILDARTAATASIRARVIPTILISEQNREDIGTANVFFTGVWLGASPPVSTPWATWTGGSTTVRIDGTRCHINVAKEFFRDRPCTIERPDPSMIAGILNTIGSAGVVAVLGFDRETDEWTDWFKELFQMIQVTKVISGGDHGAALGALKVAAELGVPTGGYLTHEKTVQVAGGNPVDGSSLEDEYGLTVLGPVSSNSGFPSRDYKLLTGYEFLPPTYAAEALGPGWEDDVAAAPAPPGYDGRPPGYRPRLPPYQP